MGVKSNFQASTELAICGIHSLVECTFYKLVHELNSDEGYQATNTDQLVNLLAVVVKAINLDFEIFVDYA